MKKLISLELRRTSLRPYFLGALCIFLGMCLMTGLLASVPAMSAAMGEPLEPDETRMFSQWELLLPVLGVLNMAAFSIFGGVLAAKFLVSEYSGKQAILLFSYPVSRKRVLAAKALLVFCLTFLSAAASLLAVTMGLALFSSLFGVVRAAFGPEQTGFALILALCQGSIAGAVGVLSALFGFRRNSLTASVVASVVLTCLLAQLLSALTSPAPMIISAGLMLLLVFPAVSALGSWVEHMEA